MSAMIFARGNGLIGNQPAKRLCRKSNYIADPIHQGLPQLDT